MSKSKDSDCDLTSTILRKPYNFYYKPHFFERKKAHKTLVSKNKMNLDGRHSSWAVQVWQMQTAWGLETLTLPSVVSDGA